LSNDNLNEKYFCKYFNFCPKTRIYVRQLAYKLPINNATGYYVFKYKYKRSCNVFYCPYN